LTLLLLNVLGFYGAPLGTALACLIAATWFLRAVKGVVQTPLRAFLPAALGWPLLASVPGGVIAFLLLLSPLAGIDRISNLSVVALGGVLFGLGYALTLRWTPFLTSYDVAFIEENLKLDKLPGFRFMTRRARKS